MIDLHHIITDGGSMPVFFRELNELYMGRELTAPAVQYRQFAAQPRDTVEDEAYWLSVFSDEVPVLEMNTDFKRTPNRSYRGDVIYDQIPTELHGKILEKCRAMNVTPYVFYMAAFNILLSKFSGNEDIVVGMPVSGREGPFVNTVGMFVNTVALRSQPLGEKTVEQFVQEVKAVSLATIEHQNYPYRELVKKLGLNSKRCNPIFDVMLVYQSESMLDVVFGDQKAEMLPIPVTTSKYDFTFNVIPKDGGAVLMVEYCTELFTESSARRLVAAYCEVLRGMLGSGRCLRDVSAIDDQQRKKVLSDFNNTAVDYPRDNCVHTLFEAQAARTPDKTAVIASDRILTYAELNAEANRIAHGLIEQGVGIGDIVAFALPRRNYLIATMLGILKAGAAYLPIDPDYPQERVEFILSDSAAKVFITVDNINELRSGNAENPNVAVSADNLCYCIYTSGSTGKPKGVLICHKNVCNFVQKNDASAFQKSLIDCCPTIICCNSLSFDITLQEIFLPLLNSREIYLFPNTQMYTAQFDEETILKGNFGLIITPTKLDLYLRNEVFRNQVMKNVSVLLCGAETFPPSLFYKLKECSNAKVFNGYGPTETTCGVLYGSIESADDIHIGKPIGNTQIYIVDKYMQPVPLGVTGELCIAGEGVGAGYLNRPELTAEKFVDNPFGPGKLYKTGDLAYWREDGNIVYVGRNDFQVKIRGLRIELGEIENAVSSVDGISQAVAVVRKDESGRQLICAFYTGKELSAIEIRASIGQKLPKYMLPHVFTHLDALPMTTSGKINRKALPEVALSNISSETEYVAPIGETERALAALMEQVLDYSPIGRDDNFFDLGGDSLKAIEFVSLAHQDGTELPLQVIFDAPTVRQLAQIITQENQKDCSYKVEDFAEIHALLAKNKLNSFDTPQRTPVGNILLSGATGFLGIHILADYLETDSGTAFCLVRGKNQADSEKRMKEFLVFYFGDRYLDCHRIQVICADLQEERFGVSATQYAELLGAVDTAINAAASVKHYGAYKDSYDANVATTKRMVSFCLESKAKLIHISTTSVSGNDFDLDFSMTEMAEEAQFTEQNLYIGQSLENVYVRSKFEAEKAVLDAVCRYGLRANIMRMGNLANRYADGQFQKNHSSNAFLKRMKAVVELGVVPDYLLDLHTEISPIDCAAAAIMEITRCFNPEKTVFHVENPHWIRFRTLFNCFRELGIDIASKPGEEFERFLLATKDSPQTEQFFEAFIENLDENNHQVFSSNILIKTDFTVEYLKALGFLWPEITIEYTKKYVEYFKKIGYWKV